MNVSVYTYLKQKKKEIDHKRELTIYEYVIHRPIDY